MSRENYQSYADWYDNGPGSEAFKRSCRTKPLKTFPNLTPSVPPPEKVFTEELYKSRPYEVGPADMIRLTINLPLTQWRKWKQSFIACLHIIRIGGE